MKNLLVPENAKVSMSYNGASGCMCGCIGSYSVLSEKESDGSRKVSPRSVKMAVNKINKAHEAGRKDVGVHEDLNGGRIAYLDDGNRNTVVYFSLPQK